MVYLSICSLVGSVSVMAIKARRFPLPWPQADGNWLDQGFGVALKLTFAGNNQLTHISTYVFGVVVVGCILIQMVCRPEQTVIWLTSYPRTFSTAP